MSNRKNMGMLLLAFVLVLWGTGTLSAQSMGTYYGLFVGIDEYYNSANGLSSCVNDAVGFRNSLLSDTNRWNINNTLVITDEDATEANIKDAIAEFVSTLGRDDIFVYFHSGHGGQSGSTTDTYLVPHDETGFWDYELANALSAFADGVKVIVIVDACHSGGLIETIPVGSSKPEETTVLKTTTSDGWNFGANVLNYMNVIKQSKPKIDVADPVEAAFITAAAYDEYSYAGDPYSLFARYLIDGFVNGDGAGSGSVDGSLTFMELFDYAYDQPAVTDEMTPQYSNPSLLSTIFAADKLTGPAPDPYEDDNSFGAARTIFDEDMEWHSILAVGDADYFTFTLSERAEITALTDGTIGDTVLTLYNSSQAQLAEDDDSGDYTFSLITETLEAGTYYLKVTELDSTDTIEAYSIALDVDIPPPPAPETLVAVSGTASGVVSLTWNSVSDADYYLVYYDDESGAPYDPSVEASEGGSPVSTTGNGIVLSGLADHFTCYFAVTAVSEYGESDYSTETSATPHPGYDVAPDEPFNLSVSSGSQTATLNWNKIGNAKGYNVRCQYDDGSTAKALQTFGSVTVGEEVTSYQFTGLTNGVTYYFSVQATNDTGTSDYAQDVSAVPSATTVASSGGGGCSVSSGNAGPLGFFPLLIVLTIALVKVAGRKLLLLKS